MRNGTKLLKPEKGDAETETKSWKFRAQGVKRKVVLLHMQRAKAAGSTQLKRTTAFASVRFFDEECKV